MWSPYHGKTSEIYVFTFFFRIYGNLTQRALMMGEKYLYSNWGDWWPLQMYSHGCYTVENAVAASKWSHSVVTVALWPYLFMVLHAGTKYCYLWMCVCVWWTCSICIVLNSFNATTCIWNPAVIVTGVYSFIGLRCNSHLVLQDVFFPCWNYDAATGSYIHVYLGLWVLLWWKEVGASELDMRSLY